MKLYSFFFVIFSRFVFGFFFALFSVKRSSPAHVGLMFGSLFSSQRDKRENVFSG